MYSEKFNRVMELVFKSEGGFNDDPNDYGGRTDKGITQRIN